MLGRNTNNGSWNGNDSIGVSEISNNLGRLETDGFDIGARYGFPIGGSRLDFAIDATHVRKINTQATPISDVHECVGNYSVACGNLTPEWKFNQRTTLSVGDFEFGLNWRYIGSMEVEEGTGTWHAPYSSIDAYNYFDLSATWRTPFDARITLTVNNLADKDPPIVGNTIGTTSQNSGNTFPQVYDVLGRFYTLGISWKF
jgi:outer membrane receptor protein involved in Fe transport